MFCNRTKEFLSQHGIVFEERDVSSDEAALEELQKRGLMTTPVTLVDDGVVVGFDPAKLAKLQGSLSGVGGSPAIPTGCRAISQNSFHLLVRSSGKAIEVL